MNMANNMKIKDLKQFDDDLDIKVVVIKNPDAIAHTIADIEGYYPVINQDTNKKSLVLEVVIKS